MSENPRATIEDLLAHRGWVRALALRLVRDENAADDLVQETWLAALRSPPRSAETARSWLGTVLRNRVRETFRRTVRRDAREGAAGPRDPAPAADEVVANADAHRHVVTTVLTLDEPYRTTVLLLYFDGLSPSAVAARLGVPVDTVRTRARRALATLRARLDRDHGGDRSAWAVAVLGIDTWRRIGGPASAGAASGAAATALGTGVAMGAGTTIGAAAAGLVVGVLLTLAVWSSGPPSGDVAQTPGAQTQVADAGGHGRTPRADARNRTDGPATRGGRDDGRTDVPTTAQAAHAAGPELPAEVRATIRGRVRLADDSPVAGVTVRARLSQPFDPTPREAGPPPRRSEEDWVADARRAARWDAATTREAVTDASGAFELTGLRDATYQMAAWVAGMELRPAGRDWNARPGETFDFRAVAKFPVEVDVTRSDGRAPGQVYVSWRSAAERGGGGGAWWSAERRTVYMDAGDWQVTAEVRDEELTSEPVAVRVGPDAAAGPVQLRLHGVPAIVGRVTVPADEPWDDVRIVAVRHDGEGLASDAELAGAKLRASARPPEYAFRIDRLEPGTYTVAASVGGRTALDRATVTVGDGPASCTLTIPPLLGDGAVRVRVTGPDGQPVTDALFGVEIRRGTGISTRGPGHASPSADGSWLVPIVTQEDDDLARPGAQWTLLVTSDRLGERRVPFVRGKDTSLDVAYAAPGSVQVTVAGYEPGRDAGHVSAALVPAGGDSPAGPVAWMRRDPGLDGQGRRTFAPVAPGNYDVELWRVVEGSRGLRVASQRIAVTAGEQAVTVPMPPLVDAVIATNGLAEGDRIELTSARAPGNYYFSLTATVDDRGEAHLPALPAGDYVVAATYGTERREMRLALPASGTYVFVPGALDGLEVTVDDPAGALARAGFRTGDVVASIDGHPFRTAYEARLLVGAAREKASIDVTVLRGGRETVVKAPPTLLSGFIEVGGRWEPVRR